MADIENNLDMEIARKRITVMGLGTHGGGVGNVIWLYKQGAILTVTDLRSADELSEAIERLKSLEGIKFVLGEHKEEDFLQADMILRNPAVPNDSKYLQLARSAGVRIEMDSSLFMRLSPTKNIIGVTGSKGKSTTTHAIAHFLALKFAKVLTVGTEGTSVLNAIGELESDDAVVFELSSWRLEAMDEHEISPSVAIVTSIYPDHLNTYDSFEHYIETKKAIIKYQSVNDRVILNYDDERVQLWSDYAKGRVAWFSLTGSIPGEGICVHRGRVSVVTTRGILELFSVDEIPFASEHEIRNVLPAIYLAYCNGVPVKSISENLKHLTGLSHRLETVRELRGVKYINDSAATIPDATVAAINSLKGKRLVLIMGGGNKRLNFEKLGEAVRESMVKALIFLPGSATRHMKSDILNAFNAPPVVHDVESMQEAVLRAEESANENDIVLLSPGATSFGLFKHEFDRGDKFRQAVQDLK